MNLRLVAFVAYNSPATVRLHRAGIGALVAGLALVVPGASLAASQQTTVTGSGTSVSGSVQIGASSNADGTNPFGTIDFQFPAGTFASNPSLTALSGDVSAGCVIRSGSTVDVVGRLPVNEQWTVESPPGSFRTIEWAGARIVDQGTATTTPVDLARVSAQFSATGAGICAGNGWPSSAPAPSLLASGDFAVVSPFNDSNGDGIVQSLQPSGTPSGSFRDTGTTPETTGSVLNANGLTVAITDAPDPDGTSVTVGSGSGFARLDSCGKQVKVNAGSTAVMTCASLIVEVEVGSIEVVLVDEFTTVLIPERGKAEIDDDGTGGFVVENLGTEPITVVNGRDSGVTVTVIVDGVRGTVEPGETHTVEGWDFQGFFQPVGAMSVLNQVKPGAVVPLKWRLIDTSGAPVTDLSTWAITVVNLDCSNNEGSDHVEQTATSGAGLQNLGDGYYQLNWKTAKNWVGCKAMHLDIGDGVTHDALFKFTT